MTSTLTPVPAGLFNYDANDRFTAGDTYDNNGNTTSSGGVANVYDFENHLIQKDGVSIKYDGDGNRLFKTVAGVTTGYILDDRSPTGYVQVLDEVQGPSITRSYVYGLELIEQDRINTSTLRQTTSYNVYDGHGSVRALTDPTGAVTDNGPLWPLEWSQAVIYEGDVGRGGGDRTHDLRLKRPLLYH